MKDEGLIEERFMVDGTDRADFALEGRGIEIFGSGEKAPFWTRSGRRTSRASRISSNG